METPVHHELGAQGARAWSARLAAEFDGATAGAEASRRPVLPAADARTPHRVVLDWTALPLRVTGCLGRERGLALLDHTGAGAPPRKWQEEYLEWRVVRDDHGITAIEMTTELPEYWRVLAAHAPERTLELVAGFACVNEAPVGEVFRGLDPFAAGVTPAQREHAFSAAMLDDTEPGPWNDGRRAICCMRGKANRLHALVLLVVAATRNIVFRDADCDEPRCLTCDEAIPLLGQAKSGRASDPLLVERLGRLGYEGRLVALDEPLGVWLRSVAHTRLRTPSGDAVRPEWFRFSRPLNDPGSSSSPPGWQRLVFSIPPETGLRIDQLIDIATERPIRHGGQVAELVQAAVTLRVSDAGVAQEDPEELATLELPLADPYCCADIVTAADAMAVAP